MRQVIIRIRLQNLFELRYGFIKFSRYRQRESQIEARQFMGGIDFQRLPVLSDSLIPLPLITQNNAEIGMRGSEIKSQFQCFPEIGDRFIVAAHLLLCKAQIRVHPGQPGALLTNRAELPGGRLILVLIQQQLPEAAAYSAVVRRPLQRFFVCLFSICESFPCR